MNHRLLLAVAGFALLGLFLWTAIRSGWSGASASFFAAACGRAGLLTLAAAFAWPQLWPLVKRFPAWFWLTLLLAGMIVIVRPRLIIVAAGLLLAAVLIQWGLGRFKPR
jgi:hypothetical protein